MEVLYSVPQRASSQRIYVNQPLSDITLLLCKWSRQTCCLLAIRNLIVLFFFKAYLPFIWAERINKVANKILESSVSVAGESIIVLSELCNILLNKNFRYFGKHSTELYEVSTKVSKECFDDGFILQNRFQHFSSTS